MLAIAVLALVPFTAATAARAGAPEEPAPITTENDFFPEERDLTDCLGTLPKPDCGSDARGGWHLYAVMIALAGGIAFIGWRVVRGMRANERHRPGAVTDEPADPSTTPSSH